MTCAIRLNFLTHSLSLLLILISFSEKTSEYSDIIFNRSPAVLNLPVDQPSGDNAYLYSIHLEDFYQSKKNLKGP